MKFITLLDKYIIKELFGPFIFGVAAFSSILAGSTVLFHLIGEAVKYGIPAINVIQLFVYKLPNIIVYSFPMSTLLATILAFSRLSSDMEIMAFRSAGISFIRIVIPVIIVGLFISLGTVWFNEVVVPKASNSAENLMRSFTDQNRPKIKRNVSFTEYDPETHAPIRTINVGEVDGQLMKNLTIVEYDDGRVVRIVRADSGEFDSSGRWSFYDGIMHNFPIKNKKRVTIIEFEKEFIDIKINPLDLSKRRKNVEEMTIKELKERIDLQKKTGANAIQDMVYYHMKFSVPFASLIFSILGASVGLRPHRSSSALGLGISIVVILIYYIILSVGMGLGLAQTIPPFMAAWFSNIVVGIVGFYFLQKIATQ